jgi:hypothetical protein
MSDDWLRLARVRDAQLAAARTAVQAERDALAEREAQAAAARSALAGVHEAKQALWRDLAQGLSGGAGGVGALRQAHAWSGALDARIARAGEQARAAQAEAEAQQARLATRQDELQRALAAAEAARGTADRLRQEARRALARRDEARIDDGAAERWLRARRS